MQQEPYFYSQGGKLSQGDAGLHCQNPYQMQSNLEPWSNNFVPDMSTLTGLYNNDRRIMQLEDPPTLLTPVSTAMYGTTSTFSWAHTVPSLMPWVTRAETTVPDPVVRFSAPFPPDPCTSQTATSWELLHNLGANKPNPNMHLKRKGDLDMLDATPPKLCITEEKMAARFREMHISNQYSIPGESSLGPSNVSATSTSINKPVTNLQQLEVLLQDPNSSTDLSSKSLVLAPELKKLVEPEKIFSTFLNKIERPSMALVVWQPSNSRLIGEDNKEKQNEEMLSSALPILEDNNNIMSQQYLSSTVHRENQSQISEDGMDM